MKLTGVKEVERVFQKLPGAIQRKSVSDAMQEEALPIVADAKARAPVAPKEGGTLRDAITVSTKLSKSQRKAADRKGKDVVAAYVGPSYERFGGKFAPHGHLVEFGTGPRFHKKTGKYVGEMPAQPFMRPAFDGGKVGFVQRFGPRLADIVERAAATVKTAIRRK